MSSHPGSTLKDAVILAEYLYKNHIRPEQVQDFYPTPGTVSTCMYYTGLDPYTLKPVFVEKTPEGKAMQRALLQYYEPRNAHKVAEALEKVHRQDLIPLLAPAAMRSRKKPVQANIPPKPTKQQRNAKKGKTIQPINPVVVPYAKQNKQGGAKWQGENQKGAKQKARKKY